MGVGDPSISGETETQVRAPCQPLAAPHAQPEEGPEEPCYHLFFIFSLIFRVLFVCFLAVLCLHCSAWASRLGGFSCCGAGLGSCSTGLSSGLSSCGLVSLRHVGSSLAKD